MGYISCIDFYTGIFLIQTSIQVYFLYRLLILTINSLEFQGNKNIKQASFFCNVLGKSIDLMVPPSTTGKGNMIALVHLKGMRCLIIPSMKGFSVIFQFSNQPLSPMSHPLLSRQHPISHINRKDRKERRCLFFPPIYSSNSYMTFLCTPEPLNLSNSSGLCTSIPI